MSRRLNNHWSRRLTGQSEDRSFVDTRQTTHFTTTGPSIFGGIYDTTSAEDFECVARHMNITKASQALHISQPSVSQQLKLLSKSSEPNSCFDLITASS